MSQLRAYLAAYIQDIQGILGQQPDDAAIIAAAEARWSEKDPRYLVFIERGCHPDPEIRLPVNPRGGGGSDGRKPNETPSPKP